MRELRPARTAVATVLGCVAGTLVGIAVGDLAIVPMVDLEGFAEFLPVLWSAIVGSLLGAGIALVIAFRDSWWHSWGVCWRAGQVGGDDRPAATGTSRTVASSSVRGGSGRSSARRID